MQVLPTISNELNAILNAMVAKFIWNARKPKIRQDCLRQAHRQGGRKLSDLYHRDLALKIEWIRRLHCDEDDQVLMQLAYYHINSKIRTELFWECNFARKDIHQFKCLSAFWSSVLHAWAMFNYHVAIASEEKINQVLWYNSHITISGNMVCKTNWIDAGIIYVKDLLFEGHIMSFHQFNQIYGDRVTVNALEFNSLISTIPRDWRKKYSDNDEYCSKYGYLTGYAKWSKIVYTKLIENQDPLVKVQQIWNRKGVKCDIDIISQSFGNINKICEIPKYRSFQYRLLHNVIILNNRLVHLGISNTNLCSNCNKYKETITHFFYECRKAQEIWEALCLYLKNQYNVKVGLSLSKIILNNATENTHSFVNMSILLLSNKCTQANVWVKN